MCLPLLSAYFQQYVLGGAEGHYVHQLQHMQSVEVLYWQSHGRLEGKMDGTKIYVRKGPVGKGGQDPVQELGTYR